MKQVVQLCLGIIGISFIMVGISFVTDKVGSVVSDQPQHICIFEIIQSWGMSHGTKWVGSYYKDSVRITAYHVIESCKNDCYIHTPTVDLPINTIKRLKNSDIGLFSLNHSIDCLPVPKEKDLLITYVSGAQHIVPTSIKNATISTQTTYGQSGSPVFSDGRVIGVVSKRWDGYTAIAIVDKCSKKSHECGILL